MFAGRTKCSRGPHAARGPHFAHLCSKKKCLQPKIGKILELTRTPQTLPSFYKVLREKTSATTSLSGDTGNVQKRHLSSKSWPTSSALYALLLGMRDDQKHIILCKTHTALRLNQDFCNRDKGHFEENVCAKELGANV